MEDDEAISSNLNAIASCQPTMRERYVLAALQGLCSRHVLVASEVARWAVEIGHATAAAVCEEQGHTAGPSFSVDTWCDRCGLKFDRLIQCRQNYCHNVATHEDVRPPVVGAQPFCDEHRAGRLP